MAAHTQRINRFLKSIEDKVAFRIPTAVITHAFDGNGDETLAIAFSGQTHRVRGKPETAPASGLTDGLGLTQRVYTPDVIQVGIDTSAEGAGLDADTELAKYVIVTAAHDLNTRLQVFQASGIALTAMVDGDASLVLNASPAIDGFGYLGNL